MDEFVQRVIEQAPVVAILLYWSIQSDRRVKSLTEAVLAQNKRLTELLVGCYDDERQADTLARITTPTRNDN